MNNLVYRNNSALYGPNIASYPVKIVERVSSSNKILITDVGSGLEYKKPLELDLIDYDRQVTNLENSATIKITAKDISSDVKGNSFGRLINGTASISKVIFKSYTGVRNVSYSLTSKSINTLIIESAFNDSQTEYDNEINVSFRNCKPGEILTSDDQCRECSEGTYSLNWNAVECKPCMDHATCSGKDIVHVDSGYWRKSVNTSKIIK